MTAFELVTSEAWNGYYEMFGEYFPTMCYPNDSPEETITKIKMCLERGEKAEIVFNLNYDEVVY